MSFQQRSSVPELPTARKEKDQSAASRASTTLSNMLFKNGPIAATTTTTTTTPPAAAAPNGTQHPPSSGSSLAFPSSTATSPVHAGGFMSSPTMTTTSGLPSTLASVSASSSSAATSPISPVSATTKSPFQSFTVSAPTSPQHRKTGSHSRFPSFSNPFTGVPESEPLDDAAAAAAGGMSPSAPLAIPTMSPPGSPRSQHAILHPAVSRNVSFVFASPTVMAQELADTGSVHTTPLNGALPLPTGTQPRSRRSSTALAVSVSLASRSRSRSSTPNALIAQQQSRSPPMSPPIGERRLSGLAKQFDDLGWDEAFADDDDDDDRPDGDFTFDVEEPEDDGKHHRTTASGRSSRRGRTSYRRSRGSYDDHLPNGEMADIFPTGHVFGAGHSFQGETIEAVAPRRLTVDGADGFVPEKANGHHRRASIERCEVASKSFRVVRQLGSGSFAVVYLVKEIGGIGQEYALKCLSKKDLNQDQLESQMFEATIHLSLPRHENVVTLHQALQTRKWLFLLMEMCPGEDLFFWLEHSRDSPPTTSSQPSEDAHAHSRMAPLSSSALPSSAVPFSSGSVLAGMGTSFAASISPAFSFSPLTNGHANGHGHHAHHLHHSPSLTSHTPTTPSLLAAYSASALLSNRRLRLIASMFVQMCEAVALCHDVGVSHRDIKPENFICCDSQELSALPRGDDEVAFYDKRKVIVKLTDFGLATSEERNTDVECGSRPYMAFECRNNLGPDYAPAPADVWSLGIVLINMLFHRQPWADPVQGDHNFDDFIASPTEFLLNKFTGIGQEVATYLAERVFCLHVEHRVTAREFGAWAKDLPIMIGGRKAVSALKAIRLNEDSDGREPLRFAKTSYPNRDHQANLISSTLTKTAPTPPKSEEPSTRDKGEADVRVQEEEVDAADDSKIESPGDALATPTAVEHDIVRPDDLPDAARAGEEEPEGSVRSTSVGKRKKRGTRKGKAAQAAQAAAAAILAGLPPPPPPGNARPPSERDALLAELAEESQRLAREMSKITKPQEPEIDLLEFPRLGEEPPRKPASKSSKLKSFLSSGNPELQALARKVQEREGPRANFSAPAQMQHASNASSSFVSGASSMTSSGSYHSHHGQKHHSSSANVSRIMEVESWRRPVDATTSMPGDMPSRGRGGRQLSDPARAGSAHRDDQSPSISGAPSLFTSRSSDSTSTFNTLSTLSTQATSMSTSASAKGGAPGSQWSSPNVKQMDAVARELDPLPRQHRMDGHGAMPEGDIVGRPPVRKTKPSGPSKAAALESISERPGSSSPIPSAPSLTGRDGGGGPTPPPGLHAVAGSNQSSSNGTARPTSPPADVPPPPAKLKAGISSFGKMFGIKSNKHRE